MYSYFLLALLFIFNFTVHVVLILHIGRGEDFTGDPSPNYLLTNPLVCAVSLPHVTFLYMQYTPWCTPQTPPPTGMKDLFLQLQEDSPLWKLLQQKKKKKRCPALGLISFQGQPSTGDWLIWDYGDPFPPTKENSDSSLSPTAPCGRSLCWD